MTPRGWVVAVGVALVVLAVPLAFAPVLAKLNLLFMKVDLMAFGGGFTTIPLIQREVVDRFGWVTTREFIDGIALGQVTPGPIVITATFVGYKAGDLLGALLGTIAVFFPSFVVLTTLVPYPTTTALSGRRPSRRWCGASWRRFSGCCFWWRTISGARPWSIGRRGA